MHILASRTRVLYVGVMNDLTRRLAEHRAGTAGAFTTRYQVDRLVYFEDHASIRGAIAREKSMKGWLRTREVALIESANPEWVDLGAAGES
ncbi:GIY-YIG nuclease family protein [Rubrivirga sp. IMCC43871]|uniref:GIY-YIG nuclease family protein n=1 Tax=Rubrivirga sp. IMCC43871 TaxID=3391575 RepID=UPI0039900CC7